MSESKFVVFRLGTEKYGLPIESVERILPTQPVTRLPKTPKMMLGVFDMRGSTVPVIDARLRFGLETTSDSQNFVVVQGDFGRCALQVDGVDGISKYEESEMDTNHSMIDPEDDFFRAIGKHKGELTVLLEPDNIVPKALRKKVVQLTVAA